MGSNRVHFVWVPTHSRKPQKDAPPGRTLLSTLVENHMGSFYWGGGGGGGGYSGGPFLRYGRQDSRYPYVTHIWVPISFKMMFLGMLHVFSVFFFLQNDSPQNVCTFIQFSGIFGPSEIDFSPTPARPWGRGGGGSLFCTFAEIPKGKGWGLLFGVLTYMGGLLFGGVYKRHTHNQSSPRGFHLFI